MKNKVTKILALSVLGVFALTACDDIVAKPTQYSEPLITVSDYSSEIYNNVASTVYDTIQEGGVGSEVLNQILYIYAVSAFGAYNPYVKVNNSEVSSIAGAITLKAAATDSTQTDAFVLAHKAYWDSSRVDASSAVTDSERERVEAKYNSIEERIAEAMYEKISTGSYSDRHVYSEKKFVKSLRSSLESVVNPADLTDDKFYETQILPEVEPKNVFDNYLHRDYYDSENNRYIVDEIVPTIYRQLLSEQYLLEETYNTLGRSYAREVNIIKFNNNANYPNAAYYLAKKLVAEINAKPTDYAAGQIAAYEADPEIEDGLLERFKDYSNAEVGVLNASGTKAAQILDGTLEPGDVPASLTGVIYPFYYGTSYGDLADKFIKMKDVAKYGLNSDYENTFTNNGAYPVNVGLEQETNALLENDNTTTGWYVKNGGLTELPEAIRSRLFNIGVATGVKESADDQEAAERTYDETKNVWSAPSGENAYICRINGHNYLKTAARVKGDAIDNDILHYDTDSKAYYIIEVKEAVSSSKLSKTGSNNYANTRGESGQEVMQTIINSVAKIVGKGESYSTLATKKYLKAMDIKYHDQSVYDYFKENYPELFDSDATSDTTSAATATSEATAE